MIGKKRGNLYPVYVYDPGKQRKVYVGGREKLRDAQDLERDKQTEFARHSRRTAGRTCGDYALRWLEEKHGEGTRRPADGTLRHNRGMLKPFLAEFTDRLIDGGIPRDEALDWSRDKIPNAKVVAAMFSDAIDERWCWANPFANRRDEEARGRRDICAITEDELDVLRGVAFEEYGPYGPTCRAWVSFSAWVGTRPAETFSRTWDHVDLKTGELVVTRAKKRGAGETQRQRIVLPDNAVRDLLAMNTLRRGPLFLTSRGVPLNKGSWNYYWRTVRAAFEKSLTPARREELLEGRDNMDLYELRHFCGSVLADRGASDQDIAHQLGNSPEVCRKTYIHTYRDRANARNRAAFDRRVTPISAASRETSVEESA